jgi:scyllo-inositol 2-dehydrogenase (NADP+)
MINVAVVGYGYAGRAFHAYLISLEPNLNLYAIAARNPDAQRVASEDYPEAIIYPTLDDLLADEKVDLVVLATPHDTHHDLAIQAMDAGKHVITDKVIALNAHEAEEMIAASERNGVLLSVFHNRRWDWDYATVKKVIDDGLLGEPYLFEVAITRYRTPHSWRGIKARGGGILYDWPAHFIDQALQLVDAPVKSVFCDIKVRDVWDTDIGNYAKLVLRFANDILYQIDISNLCAAPKPRWFVAGTKGSLIKHGIDPQEPALRARHIETAEQDPANYARLYTVEDGAHREDIIEPVRTSWTSYYRNIAQTLNGEAELAVKPEQMLRLMRVYDAAMQSAATGEVVWLIE